MTYEATYREESPERLSTPPILRGAAAFRRRLAAAVRRLQYTRMISVLNELSNDQLAEIGVRRSDIRSYAHHLIYDAD